MVGGWLVEWVGGGGCAAKMAALHAVATERDPPGVMVGRGGTRDPPGEGGPGWRFSGLRGSAGFGILSALPAKGARVSETAVRFQRLRA